MKHTTWATCLLPLLLVGCAGGSSSPDGSSTPVVPASTPASSSATNLSATPIPTTSDEPSASTTGEAATPAADGSSASATATGLPSDGSTPAKVIKVDEGSARTLVLADAKNVGDWTEGSHRVAGTSPQLTAMALPVSCYDTQVTPAHTIEYRFSDTKGVLSVDVAQDIDSDSSGNTLEFSLTVDGRLADTKSVKFKEQKTLSAPLTGAAAVEIAVKRIGSNECQQSSLALLTKVAVKG